MSASFLAAAANRHRDEAAAVPSELVAGLVAFRDSVGLHTPSASAKQHWALRMDGEKRALADTLRRPPEREGCVFTTASFLLKEAGQGLEGWEALDKSLDPRRCLGVVVSQGVVVAIDLALLSLATHADLWQNSLANLASLRTLRLELHPPTTFPCSIVSCAGLQHLGLAPGSLGGPFPWATLSQLRLLEVLGLGNNDFEPSEISPSLAQLQRLRRLDLSSCNLYGQMPPLQMRSLVFANLHGNRLVGALPAELAEWPLQQLDLSLNAGLTGTIPAALLDKPNLDLVTTGCLQPRLWRLLPNASQRFQRFATLPTLSQRFAQLPAARMVPAFAWRRPYAWVHLLVRRSRGPPFATSLRVAHGRSTGRLFRAPSCPSTAPPSPCRCCTETLCSSLPRCPPMRTSRTDSPPSRTACQTTE